MAERRALKPLTRSQTDRHKPVPVKTYSLAFAGRINTQMPVKTLSRDYRRRGARSTPATFDF